MNWTVQYKQSVVKKDIPKLDVTARQRIRKAIESKLMTDPIRFGKPLQYSMSHLRSLRVGDYRVLYAVDPETRIITVAAIAHRREVYEG